jgi:predicted aldo/keto reductase-like oxidoreductase
MEVVLATYNLANRGELDPILKQLSAEGTGFLAMKTRKDVPEADQAKTTLSLLENKDLHSILIGMPAVQDVDKWAEVPGKKMTMRDRRDLNPLMLAMAGVCGSCGRCEKACPRRIPAPDIFRFHMYATQYEAAQRAVGLAEYRRLDANATAANCDDCGACERVCPNAVPIRRRLREAHALLA